MPLEFRDLEYFSVVAQHGNLGRAAEVLGPGQPALSKCLRRLEAASQAKLVSRTAKGIALTAAGEALLAHVDRLRVALTDVARQMANVAHGRAGLLRIGVAPGFGENFLAPVCANLFAEAPDVALKVSVGTNATLLPALRRGELDLILSGVRAIAASGLVQIPLVQDEMVFYAATTHPLAARKSLRLAELARHAWVVPSASAGLLVWQTLLDELETRGLPPPSIALETSSLLLRLKTVSQSHLSASPRKYCSRNSAASST